MSSKARAALVGTLEVCAVFAVAYVAGAAANTIGVPLAWMIGPMFASALITLLLNRKAPPVFLRVLGQLIIGGALGLHLTPEAFDRILSNVLPIVAGALMLTFMAIAYGLAQARFFGTHRATALYSSVPGGPIEMAVLANQNGGDGARTALAQTLRIVFVVLLFPPILTLAAVTGSAPHAIAGGWPDTAMLLLMAAIAGIAGHFIKLTSPFFLGPMIVVGAMTASGIPLAGHHEGVVPAGQILIGVSLGAMFRRDLFRGASSFLGGLVFSTLFLVCASALVSLSLSATFGLDLSTMMLANAPGAVTEMVITAEVLRLDVAMVASFQFVRVMIALLLVDMINQLMQRHKTPTGKDV
jgi:membrane AbrB-like protein